MNNFYGMLARMKYINRWGLMRTVDSENIAEHSLEVAIIAHALAVIGNTYFGKDLDPERIAVIGMMHDTAEIITGDNHSYTKSKHSFYSKLKDFVKIYYKKRGC